MNEARIEISEDALVADLVLPAGVQLKTEQLRDLIAQYNISTGLNKEVLRQALVVRFRDRRLPIARGQAPQQALPGKIIPPIDPTHLPLQVSVGQQLGYYQSGQSGQAGITVHGDPLESQLSRNAGSIGAGLWLDEEEQLSAQIDGWLCYDEHGTWLIQKQGQEYKSSDLKIEISADRMEASLSMPAGAYCSDRDLAVAIKSAGIHHGLIPLAMRACLQAVPQATRRILAQGTQPGEPQDASMEYIYARENEEDVTHLMYRQKVFDAQLDQCLALFKAGVSGHSGMTVTGEKIEPKTPRDIDLQKLCGEGVRLAQGEEVAGLYAERPGIIRQERFGSLNVEEVMLVRGDVNAEVGNIETEFAVVISGSISAGFSVKSRSSISVGGVIEDAHVSARGDLHVQGGILPGQMRVKAQGDVSAAFIYNRTVKGNNIIVREAIRNAHLFSTETVQAKRISGGEILAAARIQCDILGSHIENETHVHVGIDPMAMNIVRDAQALLGKNEELVKQAKERAVLCKENLNRAIINFEKSPHPGDKDKLSSLASEHRRAVRALQDVRERIGYAQEDLETYLPLMYQETKAEVVVEKTVHAQVQIRIGRRFATLVRNELAKSTFNAQGLAVK